MVGAGALSPPSASVGLPTAGPGPVTVRFALDLRDSPLSFTALISRLPGSDAVFQQLSPCSHFVNCSRRVCRFPSTMLSQSQASISESTRSRAFTLFRIRARSSRQPCLHLPPRLPLPLPVPDTMTALLAMSASQSEPETKNGRMCTRHSRRRRRRCLRLGLCMPTWMHVIVSRPPVCFSFSRSNICNQFTSQSQSHTHRRSKRPQHCY